MFWHCQIIAFDLSFWFLPELLIYKTTAFANNSNTDFFEFRSQCRIFRFMKKRNLRIQGRMQIFEKMFQKALNRVLTLPDYSIWPELLISSGIIDLQNNRVCKQFKHWKYRISVPMLYIAFIHGQQMSRIQTIYCHNHKIIITITVAKL